MQLVRSDTFLASRQECVQLATCVSPGQLVEFYASHEYINLITRQPFVLSYSPPVHLPVVSAQLAINAIAGGHLVCKCRRLHEFNVQSFNKTAAAAATHKRQGAR